MANPIWTQGEIEVLLRNYQTKEMYELEEIMANYDFPRPPEGIKRKLEKLLVEGMSLDKERIKYLGKRKFWRKEAYLIFKGQLSIWRKNNPRYFRQWFMEHRDYMKQFFATHIGYQKRVKKRFLEKHPDYFRNYYRQFLKDYNSKYKRLTRHIDVVLPKVFNSNPELSLQEISSRIGSLSGIHLGEVTLENIIKKYESKASDPPLVKTESGNYRLNHSFYAS